MPKARSPNRGKALEIYREHGGDIENRKIAKMLDVPEKTISAWKVKDKWNGVLQTSKRSTPKHKGGQPGNKNAVDAGPPSGNKNSEKHGFFSKWLPEETAEIMQAIEKSDPLDILWDNIQLQYTAIIRAQKLMYVRDQEDVTTTKIGEGFSESGSSEKWEVQQAWDKHATFLTAQSRAMKTLEGMIKQYDELLHKNWDLATDEQKARIAALKTKAQANDPEGDTEDDGFMDALAGKVDDAWQDE